MRSGHTSTFEPVGSPLVMFRGIFTSELGWGEHCGVWGAGVDFCNEKYSAFSQTDQILRRKLQDKMHSGSVPRSPDRSRMDPPYHCQH